MTAALLQVIARGAALLGRQRRIVKDGAGRVHSEPVPMPAVMVLRIYRTDAGLNVHVFRGGASSDVTYLVGSFAGIWP